MRECLLFQYLMICARSRTQKRKNSGFIRVGLSDNKVECLRGFILICVTAALPALQSSDAGFLRSQSDPGAARESLILAAMLLGFFLYGAKKKKLYLPEQHDCIVPIDERIVVEIEAGNRFILLDPICVPKQHHGIVPVSESVGIQIFNKAVIVWICWGLMKPGSGSTPLLTMI